MAAKGEEEKESCSREGVERGEGQTDMHKSHLHWESSRAVWNFWRTSSLVCPACGGEGGPDYPSMHGSLWSVVLSSFPNHFIQSVPVGGCGAAFSAHCRGTRDLRTQQNTSGVLLKNMQGFLMPSHYLQWYHFLKQPSQQFNEHYSQFEAGALDPDECQRQARTASKGDQFAHVGIQRCSRACPYCRSLLLRAILRVNCSQSSLVIVVLLEEQVHFPMTAWPNLARRM